MVDIWKKSPCDEYINVRTRCWVSCVNALVAINLRFQFSIHYKRFGKESNKKLIPLSQLKDSSNCSGGREIRNFRSERLS